MSVEAKRQCIEPEHSRLSVARQCELIGLSRSSYYQPDEVGTESEENLALMRLIDEEYTRHPFLGVARCVTGCGAKDTGSIASVFRG